MLDVRYIRHRHDGHGPSLGDAAAHEALALAAALIPGAEVVLAPFEDGHDCVLVCAASAARRRWLSLLPVGDGDLEHVGGAAARALIELHAGLVDDDVDAWVRLRRAAEVAHDAGTLGPVLGRLFDLAATAGRRARTETLVGLDPADVGPDADPDVRRASIGAARRDARPHVESIVDETVDRFDAWLERDALDSAAAAVAVEAEVAAQFAAGDVDGERQRRTLQRAVRRLVHEHIAQPRSTDPSTDRTRKDPTS